MSDKIDVYSLTIVHKDKSTEHHWAKDVDCMTIGVCFTDIETGVDTLIHPSSVLRIDKILIREDPK